MRYIIFGDPGAVSNSSWVSEDGDTCKYIFFDKRDPNRHKSEIQNASVSKQSTLKIPSLKADDKNFGGFLVLDFRK